MYMLSPNGKTLTLCANAVRFIVYAKLYEIKIFYYLC